MATVVLPETTQSLYPFKSHFLTLSDGKRMHYLDEGPENGDVLVFVHGYPTWSFLYRAFLVYYAAQGFRCIALDHIGYGMSDKPTSRRYHTMRRHITNLIECIRVLDLHHITLIVEDWGSSFALSYAVSHPDNVRRLVITNSTVFQDTYLHWLHPLIKVANTPGLGEILFGYANLVTGLGLQYLTVRPLSPAVIGGYRAPFRDSRSRTALVQFPRMINTTASHPSSLVMRDLEQNLFRLHTIPTLIVWGKDDPLFAPAVADHWKRMLPHARGPILIRGGHILAEDAPETMMQHMDTFFDKTSFDVDLELAPGPGANAATNAVASTIASASAP
ncbi:MAG: alpha/beta fold hydrolase [Anaerolineae bacterium]|nr:alpha/beta fold hydrolase [Anaerolineae bacterium]